MNKLNIFWLFLLLGLTACDKNLDIEPEQSISISGAFSNEATTRASLNGAYSAAQDLDVFGAMPQIINDFMADNVGFIGSFPTLIEIRDFTTLTDNATIQGIFRDHYIAILSANAVIFFTPDVDDPAFSQEEKDDVVGQAKFLRALLYHNLVTLFGQPYTLNGGSSQGVALILTPDALTGGDLLIGRSTVAQVYTAIEADLNDAINLLPNFGDLPGGLNRITPCKSSARALLSRINLHKGDYSNAASLADAVIKSGNYTLASDFSFYNAETAEDVFSLAMSAIDNSRTGSGGWASFYNPAEKGARGDCPFSADLLAAYDQANDLRFTTLTQVGDNGATYTSKFPDAANNSDNAPLIRITEMYLTRAEALAETNGVDSEAISILNQIRTRAGLSTFTAGDFANGGALVNQILTERRKELCFEGHRRNDLLRRGKNLRPGGGSESAPGATRVVLPIPQRDIDLGSSLPQNDGY